SQRSAITAILRVLYQPHAWIELGCGRDQLGRRIPAAVVYDNDLVVGDGGRKSGLRFLNGLVNRRLFVPSWENQRKLVTNLPIVPRFRGLVQIAARYVHPCHSLSQGNARRWEDRQRLWHNHPRWSIGVLREQVEDGMPGAGRSRKAIGAETAVGRHSQGVEQRGAKILR